MLMTPDQSSNKGNKQIKERSADNMHSPKVVIISNSKAAEREDQMNEARNHNRTTRLNLNYQSGTSIETNIKLNIGSLASSEIKSTRIGQNDVMPSNIEITDNNKVRLAQSSMISQSSNSIYNANGIEDCARNRQKYRDLRQHSILSSMHRAPSSLTVRPTITTVKSLGKVDLQAKLMPVSKIVVKRLDRGMMAATRTLIVDESSDSHSSLPQFGKSRAVRDTDVINALAINIGTNTDKLPAIMTACNVAIY